MIGYVAAACTTVSFVPQVVRVIRTQDTAAISLSAYALFCAGVAAWLLYGIAIASYPIVIANGCTLALASAILLLKLRDMLR